MGGAAIQQEQAQKENMTKFDGLKDARIEFVIDEDANIGARVSLNYTEDLDEEFIDYIKQTLAGMYGMITTALAHEEQLEDMLAIGEAVRQQTDFDALLDSNMTVTEVEQSSTTTTTTTGKVKYLI